MKHKIIQGFIIIYWKWFFGAHLSNLRNDKLNIRNRQIFYKQTDKNSICKISNENDMPFKLGNRWYSYNKFSIVYQFHRLYENTTYYLTYVTVPGTRVPLSLKVRQKAILIKNRFHWSWLDNPLYPGVRKWPIMINKLHQNLELAWARSLNFSSQAKDFFNKKLNWAMVRYIRVKNLH